MKQISCGVVLINDDKILACKPYGKKLQSIGYDLPKGHVDHEEPFIECAIRELYEETGIIVTRDDLFYLGEYDYTKHKNLVLFLCNKRLDISECKCISTFELADGREVQEIVGYDWININDLDKFYPNLQKVLTKALKQYEVI